ncbi:MAG: four helix bundle protein [Actinobacteria bacterium]|nr:four helix bundle protein [Actinomycetota bacterium]
MNDFKNLKVWERAHKLALSVHKETAQFPKEEQFGLTSQMRRAAYSIPTNIAEGCGRGGDNEFSRFLRIARGSAKELEYQTLLAYELGYLGLDQYEHLSADNEEVQRMLRSLLKKLIAQSS